jgi:polar amino acid transport system substrate-binding protein
MNSSRTDKTETDVVLSRRSLAALPLAAVAATTLGAGALVPTPVLAQSTTSAVSASGRLDRILKTGKLRVGQYLQFKPFGFKTPSGEPQGFDVDLTKMLTADMGVEPEFIDSTWEGIIPGLLSDKFDLITANLAITVKRSLVVQYANPISFTSSAFVVRADNAGKFPSLDAFNDPSVTVSVLIQDAVHNILARFFPKAQVVDFNTADEAILAMQTGKVMTSAAEISYLTQFTKEHQGLKVMPIDMPGSSSPAAMAMMPGADNQHLLSFVNTWVQFYYWTGRFQPLWQKWTPWNPIPKVEKFMAPV